MAITRLILIFFLLPLFYAGHETTAAAGESGFLSDELDTSGGGLKKGGRPPKSEERSEESPVVDRISPKAERPSQGEKLPPSEIFSRVEPAVVIVVLKFKGEYIGHGSGFLVKPNGYILTNNHVVDVRDFGELASGISYEVVTSEGKSFTPQIIKTDPELDIALLKISGKDLPSLRIGDAGEVKVGEEAFIVGTPIRMEFSRSMISGIVSGFNRDKGRIQTSAVIHGGNSGGPAFNNKGEVIGIAVAVAAGADRKNALIGGQLVDMVTSQEYYGISYLIPINHAKNLLNLMY
ncbi:MAG: trypsin-like peptidase domain-containing protein [Nitrospinae bacterium]|nr:trypsin-like peptidase domain-containing protein [Nitrospinota bacterium]